MIGKHIQHYQIRERLGAGGMGEVWQATDSKLGRDVALKILPPHLADDPERMARFRREAQLLASLNHPNIGAIYGLEESDGVHCLVLELVRGETLSARISRDPLPLDEALLIARQIADAMEVAHDQGVMHRDLKPGNVMITHDGAVKVLDFGLAKAFEGDVPERDLSMSPTITARATMAGVILGTAAYMSPEQAKGKTVDRRADIWSFGVVLFEMLTGKQAFTGETVSEVLAAVMMREIEWDALPASLPVPIRRLLRRCLDKDPRRRLRDIGEARLMIEDYLANPNAAEAAAAPSTQTQAVRTAPWPWVAAGVAGAIAVIAFWSPWRSPAPPPPLMEFDVELSPEPLFSGYGAATTLSRTGDRIAFVTEGEDRTLFVRDVSDPEPREIGGTELAYHQFFSPDGDWIGFFTRTELNKVSIRGGSPLTLAPVALNRGGTWGDDGTIVYAPNPGSGLLQIPASGGEPVAVTELDSVAGEISHRWPHWIPGKNIVLFTVFSNAPGLERGRIEALDLDTGKRKLLHHGGTYPKYVPTGHILYVYEQTLFALPFDVDRLEVTGNPGPVIENLRSSQSEGAAQIDVSLNGTLVGMFGGDAGATPGELVRMQFDSSSEEVLASLPDLYSPTVSPEGRRVAISVGSFSLADVWVYDVDRGTQTRMTFAEGKADWHAIWSPDGRLLAYSSNEDNATASVLRVKAADGSGDSRRLGTSQFLQAPESWSPDGKTLVFSQQTSGSWGIWKIPVDGQGEPEVVLDTPALETSPRLSPDGRWLAYQSNESGRAEVYVRPFPGPGGKWQISTNGGVEPRWSRTGREIFYRTEDSLYSVAVAAGASALEAGRPRGRLRMPAGPGPISGSYDLLADDSGVIVARNVELERDVAPLRRVRLTLNWFERLRELAPTGGP